MLTVVLPSVSPRIYGQDNVNFSVGFVHLLVVISENNHYYVVFVNLLWMISQNVAVASLHF